MKFLLKMFAILLAMFLISGCSSSDSADSSVTGTFVDDPVSGLTYECSSGTVGVTDAEGKYTCENGDSVTFSIGDVVIGTVGAEATIVTPYSFFPNNQDAALNLARLLQSVDSDPSDNIITLDETLVALLDGTTDFRSSTFVADVEGILHMPLVSVQDAQTQLNETIVSAGGDIPDGANIPVANAGVDQNIHNNDTVTLDGSASSDADGDSLTYSWSITSKPPTSGATLSDSTVVNPNFIADKSGVYTVELIVNDGNVSSAADELIVTATFFNAAPVANAGVDQNVNTTDIVTLHGIGTDADGDGLTSAWTTVSIPAGSVAVLDDAFIASPSFEADLDGNYTFSYVVNDGTVDSLPDLVVVTASTVNSAPVADAGPDQYLATYSDVTLDGSGSSDANSDSLTYTWIVTKPDNTTFELTGVRPIFTLDDSGVYSITVVVNDGTVDSSNTDTVLISSILVELVAVHHGFHYSGVVSPYTGRVWLDRNLGASQVCTAYNDTSCYGGYYQWGREHDGHESSTSEATNVLATGITNVGIYYIKNLSLRAVDWIDTEYSYDIDNSGVLRSQNWSKTDGSSVCPVGYRVPTSAEIVSETSSVTTYISAFYNFLKLPSNGKRLTNGNMSSYDNSTSLWTSDVGTDGVTERRNSIYRYFSSYGATTDDNARANGYGVRCIKD